MLRSFYAEYETDDLFLSRPWQEYMITMFLNYTLPPGPSGGSQDSVILSFLAFMIRGESGTNEGLAFVCHD